MTTTELDQAFFDQMRPRLPEVSVKAVAAIMAEVPTYNRALDGPMGEAITGAVQLALEGFLRVAARGHSRAITAPSSPVTKGAYSLGAAESRSGRAVEALLAAYRIGARVSWHELSRAALELGASAEQVATLAEQVFAYIDELSATSVAGHHDQEESSGRVRRQRLDRLGQALLRGDSDENVDGWVERAEWQPPRTLTAVLLPHAQVRAVLALLPEATLHPSETPLNHPDHAVLLVAGLGSRRELLRALSGRQAVVGSTRGWRQARSSYLRAVRGLELPPGADPDAPIDTEAYLATLVVNADPEAAADLRERALAPLATLTPASREKLSDTLRSWLLNQGRRDAVAGELFVHPQTVRYRVGQLRELYGARLDDPATVLELILALTVRPGES